jgi:hypothetical protein
LQYQEKSEISSKQTYKTDFYLKLEKDSSNLSANGAENKNLPHISSVSTNLSTLSEDSSEDTKVDENVLIVIKKSLLDLTLKANGKADLYFHAYFWSLYITSIFERTNSTASTKDGNDFDSLITKKNIEV